MRRWHWPLRPLLLAFEWRINLADIMLVYSVILRLPATHARSIICAGVYLLLEFVNSECVLCGARGTDPAESCMRAIMTVSGVSAGFM